jgi:uncharacterized membrane protein HdeD (DUF308 family)
VSASPAESHLLFLIRRFILALFALGLAGISAELVVLRHYEDSWQLVPLFLLGFALAVVVWLLLERGAAPILALRMIAGFFVIAGVAGIILHYRANLEFQLDMDSSQHGWPLFLKVIHAQAPPALAPGAMAQLGLLGWLYTFRHPAISREGSVTPTSGEQT